MHSYRISPGEPYGDLPVPRGAEFVGFESPIGTLTGLRVIPKGTIKGHVLLIPGYTGSKEDFFLLLPLLADHGYDCWSFSRRGQAGSVWPEDDTECTLDETIADAAAVAAAVSPDPDEELHLVGHSLGGVIAQATAIAHPELFSTLTLLCTGPRGWKGRKAADRAQLEQTGVLWHEPTDLTPYEIQHNWRDFYWKRAHDTSATALLSMMGFLEDEHDRTAEIAATHLPVHVVHGDHDPAWPIEWQRKMADDLDALYTVIPDAAHRPNIEQPELTADALTASWDVYEAAGAAA